MATVFRERLERNLLETTWYNLTAHATNALGATVALGLDVSRYQGTINWNSVKAAGYSFAFAKASEGTTIVDSTFATNWNGMKAAGIFRGAYHFFRPAQDALTQAQKFVALIAGGDLPPVIDLEVLDGVPGGTVLTRAGIFIAEVIRLTKKRPLIYTSRYMWSLYGGNPSWTKDVDLWAASWSTTVYLPSAWTTYRFWQTSSTGKVPGIAGSVDMDQYTGTLDQLKTWIGAVPPPPPPPPPPPSDIAATVKAVAGILPLLTPNPAAPIYVSAQANGYGYPQTDEFEVVFEGTTYTVQGYDAHLGYVTKGQSTVSWIGR
jgi:lysozyme